MIASVLLAALVVSSASQPERASLGISLRVVDVCDMSAGPDSRCAGSEYDRWLQEHALTKRVVDAEGRDIVEVQF